MVEILRLDTPQTILVVEDKLSFAYRLIYWLEGQGHTVYGYAGVFDIDGETLKGVKPLGETTPPDIDLQAVIVCFLDHYFEGESFTGTTLTKELVPLGIKVCGMSSVDDANKSMIRVGAVCAYRKDVLSRVIP